MAGRASDGDVRPPSPGRGAQCTLLVLAVIKGLGRGGAERLVVEQVTDLVGDLDFESSTPMDGSVTWPPSWRRPRFRSPISVVDAGGCLAFGHDSCAIPLPTSCTCTHRGRRSGYASCG